jgi:DnaJ-class molecular chaperone
MATPTIEINMDEKCSKCGKKGATSSGMCLDCSLKGLFPNRISFDGQIVTTSTNWPKHETKVGIQATYAECEEIEAEALGEMIRNETAVKVSICDSKSTGEIIDFTGNVEAVRTDWKNMATTVTFSVLSQDPFEKKSGVLGKWGERHIVITCTVEPAQARLL